MMCRLTENVVEKLSVETNLCRLVKSYECRNCCKSSLYHTYETSTENQIQWKKRQQQMTGCSGRTEALIPRVGDGRQVEQSADLLLYGGEVSTCFS
jgi:hypothetical protein